MREAEDDHPDGDGDDAGVDLTFLSLYYRGGRIGAALFNAESATLRLLTDVQDLMPDLRSTEALIRQTQPSHLLVCGRQPEPLIRLVKELCGVGTPAAAATGRPEADKTGEAGDSNSNSAASGLAVSTSSASARCSSLGDLLGTSVCSLPLLASTELRLVCARDFAFGPAKRRLLDLRLAPSAAVPGEAEAEEDEGGAEQLLHTRPEQEQFLFINSLFDLQAECSVRAAGALLRFVEATLGPQQPVAATPCFVLSVGPLTIDETLTIDDTSLKALQIFNSDSSLSGSKSGSWNRSRERLSIYQLLNRCKSILGSQYLRYFCRCPLRSEAAILERQAVVGYFSSQANTDLLTAIQACLIDIKNVPKILKKVGQMQASVRDWKWLKTSLRGLLTLCDLCRQQKHTEIQLLNCLADCATKELYRICDLLERILDLELSEQRNKFTVKAGVDDDLDEKRRMHNGLPDLLLQIAKEEIEELPDYMTSCVMSYIPQIGYLLAVAPWSEELSEEDFILPDLDFLFVNEGVPYFKSRRCKELDKSLGDTVTAIADHETKILLKVANYIVAYAEYILSPIRYAALLDCLLALATTSLEYGWTQPRLGGKQLRIQGGRHPLQELCTDTFVANPTWLGGESGARMAVLTGPNACGKSVYLKQVGIIVYLAHLGSNVPAVSCTIQLMDRIFTRIQTVESLSMGLSAFMVDVNQISCALRYATGSSLVLLDEFGKGTAADDGEALLVSCLENFASRAEGQSPFVIATTHFHQTKSLLAANRNIAFNTFECISHNGELVFLYKIQSGHNTTSEAFHTAKLAGIEPHVLARATDVLRAISQGSNVRARKDVYPLEEIEPLANEFLSIDFKYPSSSELEKLLSKIRQLN